MGRVNARRFLIASVVALGLGVPSLICGVVEAGKGRAGGWVAVVFGLLLVLISLVPVFNRKRAFRPRRMVIEQAGLRWDDPRGEPWSVRWEELAAVALVRAEPPNVNLTVTSQVAGAAVEGALGKNALVYVDLFPADAGFPQRHPEMAHLWSGDRLRLLISTNPRLLPQLDAPMRHFQPGRYHGIQRVVQSGLRLRGPTF